MSAITGSSTYEMDTSYAADFSRDREPMKKRSRHPEYRRKGSAPTRVNGMHCRRSKRWTWGSGRGARMANLRAFASCLAMLVAALGTSAFAQVPNFLPVGNAGNSGNPGNNSLGAVSYAFSLADKETTNAQYASFLNSVDPNGTNPNGIYVTAMGTSAFGGIQNTGTVNGSRYVVKSGTAPNGASYGSMPVNNVTWFSAARFVNWLQSGSTETGAYTLNGQVSGSAPVRNAGTQYALPNVNEWYKAAFFAGSGTSYNLYQTNTSLTPTATTNGATSNAANFSNASTGPLVVGTFTNASTSFYGMYDMLGNVTEYTETGASASAVYFMGANYSNTALANWSSAAALRTTPTAGSADATGFRVAQLQVAPVPEPETITLAAFGIVGLCGANWLKRRRKPVALPAPADDLVAA